MEIDRLNLISLSGFSLNVQERSSIDCSLAILKHDENLQSINLWGKILGAQKDYLIVQGISAAQDIFSAKYFFSMDNGMTWGQLFPPSQVDLKKSNMIYKRFLGDPAFVYRSTGQKDDEEGDEAFTEEKRLSAVVYQITNDVFLVPKGSYYKNSSGKIVPNQLYTGTQECLILGLPRSEVKQLSSYLHLRLNKNSGNDEKAFDDSLDIFDPIEKDEPKGCWSLKVEQGGQFVVLKSLIWPGFVAFYNPEKIQFGCFYLGTGQKNVDIGYEL